MVEGRSYGDINKYVCISFILLRLDLGEKSNFRRYWIWIRLLIWVGYKHHCLTCMGWRTCSKDILYFMEIREGIQEGKIMLTYFKQWLLHLALINYPLCKNQYRDLFPEGFTDWNEITLVSGSGSIVTVIHLLIYHINISIKTVLSGLKIRVSKWGGNCRDSLCCQDGSQF